MAASRRGMHVMDFTHARVYAWNARFAPPSGAMIHGLSDDEVRGDFSRIVHGGCLPLAPQKLISSDGKGVVQEQQYFDGWPFLMCCHKLSCYCCLRESRRVALPSLVAAVSREVTSDHDYCQQGRA